MPRWIKRTLLSAIAVALAAACSSRPTPAPVTPAVTATAAPTVQPSPQPTATATPLPDPVALHIGSGVIYTTEVEIARRQLDEALQKRGLSLPSEQQEAAVLADLVDQELLAQAAVESGFILSTSDYQAILDGLSASLPGGLGAWLSASGYSEGLFQAAFRRLLTAASMRDNILMQIPVAVEQVRARQVVLPTREEAQRVLEAARQAGSLQAIAYAYDPYTGGDLGWFPRGVLYEPAVEEAAFSLPDPTGDQPALSDPVQSSLGFHVLQRLGRETRPLSTAARVVLQQKALDAWLSARRQALNLPRPETPFPWTVLPSTDGTPRYVVQEGENYYQIAQALRLPVQTLIDANPGSPPEALSPGSELVIPGAGGYEGPVVAVDRPTGSSPDELARAYRLDPLLLARLNRLTSTAQLWEGAALVLPEAALDQTGAPPVPVMPVPTGGTLHVEAMVAGENPWSVALASGTLRPSSLLPGAPLLIPAGEGRAPQTPPLDIDRIQLVQGSTQVIFVPGPSETFPSGKLDGRALHFFKVDDGWVALQGMPALGEPGLSILALQTADRGHFELSLPFFPGDFPQDPPLTVDPATIDPAVTAPEETRVAEITGPATEKKWWDGLFRPPVDSPGCFRSTFGNRRSFNGSPYSYFHSGLDYGVCGGPEIYAPAPGQVVFAGPLDVRGNATIVDHGWGVYSGFWHQSEILVEVGDAVQAGQVIGKIGATGRITGEHLHWEVWAGGVQVDPMDWLEQVYPQPQ